VILMDTSLVIDDIRGKDAKLQALLPGLPVAVCGLVRAEILCGARDAAHRSKLLVNLMAYQQLPFPDSIWDSVGDNLAALRRNGFTFPFPDVAIATLGIHQGIEVWARDRHFADIQKVLPALKLYQEPP
jgi:predicted nucleic acid-binding protein